MIRLTLSVAVTLLMGFVLADLSLAQNTGSAGLFGNRSVGTGATFSAGQRNLTGNRTTGDTAGGGAAAGERFSRDNRQGQFVGSDSADFQNFLSQAARAGAQQGRGPGAQGGRGGQGNFNQRGGQQQRRTIRASLRVAFTYRQRSVGVVAATLSKRLSVSRHIRAVLPVEVTISNRTATLRGVVATAGDRDLAARLVLLEPGISRVENALTIAQSDDQPD